MKVSYYPGCTLRNKARELDIYARSCAQILGVEMIEPAQWQCCGGVFVTSKDEIATKLSSVRVLREARDAGVPLVTLCSACHNVIKQTNYAMQTDKDFASRVNLYLTQDNDGLTAYDGEAEVIHYLELLRDKIGFDAIARAVVKPLTGRRIAAYYGCLLLRPGKVMDFDDVENPRIIEDFIRALGAEPVIFPRRNECCGAYVALEDPEAAKTKSRAVSRSAALSGAQEIVTSCPLCRYNLIKNGSTLPVKYLTELMAEAFGVKEELNA